MTRDIRYHAFKVGDIVQLTQEAERFSPDFFVSEGATGTVVEAEWDYLSVRIHTPVPGAEEWDNCLVWTFGDVYFKDGPENYLVKIGKEKEA